MSKMLIRKKIPQVIKLDLKKKFLKNENFFFF